MLPRERCCGSEDNMWTSHMEQGCTNVTLSKLNPLEFILSCSTVVSHLCDIFIMSKEGKNEVSSFEVDAGTFEGTNS